MHTQLFRDLADELDESTIDAREDAHVTLTVDSLDADTLIDDVMFDAEVIDSAAGLKQVRIYLH